MNLQISLTKKLNDALFSLSPLPRPSDHFDPFYSWHSNLLFIKKKKCVLFCNDATMFSVFLYDVKKADMKKLNWLFFNQMVMNLKTFSSSYFSEGDEMVFCKTHSRQILGCMNDAKVMIDALFWHRELREEEFCQAVNDKLNDMIYMNDNFCVPLERFTERLKQE